MKDKQVDTIILSLESLMEGNTQAAINSPQCADWNNGVAKGLELALLTIEAAQLLASVSQIKMLNENE